MSHDVIFPSNHAPSVSSKRYQILFICKTYDLPCVIYSYSNLFHWLVHNKHKYTMSQSKNFIKTQTFRQFYKQKPSGILTFNCKKRDPKSQIKCRLLKTYKQAKTLTWSGKLGDCSSFSHFAILLTKVKKQYHCIGREHPITQGTKS